jgi:PAS domain S-box-containing protein
LLHSLFPGTPVVVAGATEEEVSADQFPSPVSGVASRTEPRATLELIFRLQPETKRVVVVGGTAQVDRRVLDRVKQAARLFAGQAKFEFWNDRSMAELQKEVAALPPRTAILVSRMFQDGAGQALISSNAARSIAQWASVPVYVMTDAALGSNAVGGSFTGIEAIGKRAGEMARLILTGTPPESLPLESDTGRMPVFDWRALQRWNIPETRLPPGSVVRFKPQSIWEQYRGYVIAALMIILMQAVLIVDLLLHRARRRRAEAELLASRQFMELATEAGEMGLWVRDMVGNEIWANPRFRALFGFGPHDALNISDFQTRVHPDDRHRLATAIENARDGGKPFDVEFRTALPLDERWITAKGKFIRDSNGKAFRTVGTVIDISARKKAEQRLRESEENFRRLVETTSAVLWQADVDTWAFTYVAPQAAQLLGYPVQQWYEKDFWVSHIHPDDRKQAIQTCLMMSQKTEDFDFEYRMIKASGEIIWIHDVVNSQHQNGKPVQLRGLMIDITARKEAEAALKRERQFLRQVIDTDPNFIFAKDREGRFTLANKAVADAYGTTVENLIGKTDADFNPHRDEVESFRQMDLQVIDTLQERFIPEERITNGHGRVRWLQTVKRPIIESDGSVNQVLGASTDITQRKQTEMELREQREELAHVARISTMGELAASLAHELNQPLTAILSNAQAALRFLSSKPADIEEVREILQDIVKDNSRASEVIRRMRSLVKKEAIEFAPVDMPSLVRDVAALVHSDAILLNVKLLVETTDGLPAVHGDKVQLQQVVLNLLLNAFDAMKECPPTERQVKLSVERNDAGLIQTAVSDRGPGLSHDKLDKIFQPFYTTKGEGLGMGLSICRSIIEAHGGRLWAENNPDRGATFYFTLPLEGAQMKEKKWNDGIME